MIHIILIFLSVKSSPIFLCNLHLLPIEDTLQFRTTCDQANSHFLRRPPTSVLNACVMYRCFIRQHLTIIIKPKIVPSLLHFKVHEDRFLAYFWGLNGQQNSLRRLYASNLDSPRFEPNVNVRKILMVRFDPFTNEVTVLADDYTHATLQVSTWDFGTSKNLDADFDVQILKSNHK